MSLQFSQPLGMKFAIGEKATCIKTDPDGYLRIYKEYDIIDNAGVRDSINETTEYIVVRISDLEHDDYLLEEELRKGTMAFKTEFFEHEEKECYGFFAQ